jgi:glycogen synthase
MVNEAVHGDAFEGALSLDAVDRDAVGNPLNLEPVTTLLPGPSVPLLEGKKRLLVVIGAPVDVIAEYHRRGRAPAGEPPLRTSLGNLFEMSERCDLYMHVISSHARAGVERHGRLVLEHRPRPVARGQLGYYAADLAYARFLVERGRELGAEVAIIESGSIDYFMMELLVRAGMHVVPLLHHTLWPNGHPPRRLSSRVRRLLNGRFFRKHAGAVICVSPAVARQVRATAGRDDLPVREMRLQLDWRAFEGLDRPPPHGARPFGVLYTGRIERSKGVFDIVQMARVFERRYPGQLRWTLLGDGFDREELLREVQYSDLHSVIDVPGWMSIPQMRCHYERAHIAVVPTRSDFAEGMAMAAIEAVVAGRPVVTSSVVPALEVVRPGCVEAEVDDVGSYVAAIERLMLDEQLYESRRVACATLGHEFFDTRLGMASTIAQLLGIDNLPEASDELEATINPGERTIPRLARARPVVMDR